MEEKVLLKSKQTNIKRICFSIWLIGLILAFLVSIPTLNIAAYQECKATVAEYQAKADECRNLLKGDEPYEGFFEYREMDLDTYLRIVDVQTGIMRGYIRTYCVQVLVTYLPVLIGGLIVYAWLSKNEMTVTNKRVYGKAIFGKRVDLPLDSISAVGSCWPKGIAVASSSGKVSFVMFENRDELHKCISDLLIERQQKEPVSPIIKQEIPQSQAEELKKYKELLDMGVLSQEEFDAKKKQLLGL